MKLVRLFGIVLLAMVMATSADAMIIGGTPTDHGPGLAPGDFTLTGSKWEPGGTAAFNPGQIPSPGGATWSIMGAGFVDVSTFDPGHVGATQAFTNLGVTGWVLADYAAALNAAFNVWSAVALIDNLGQVADGNVNAGATEASGGGTGNIRFAAWEIGTANVLAHAFQPGTEAIFGAGGSIGGDTHFDLGFDWEDDATDTTADNDIDFFTVALHEIGHALGLGHSGVLGSVMEPVYAGARRTLSADDIAGIQALYGARQAVPEPVSLLLFGLGLGGFAYRRYQRS